MTALAHRAIDVAATEPDLEGLHHLGAEGWDVTVETCLKLLGRHSRTLWTLLRRHLRAFPLTLMLYNLSMGCQAYFLNFSRNFQKYCDDIRLNCHSLLSPLLCGIIAAP